MKSSLLIDEFIELIQSICSPPLMKDILKLQQKREKDPAALEDAYIDYESLREILCSNKAMVGKMLNLLSMKQLQHIKHM
jgi:hypothetical protein